MSLISIFFVAISLAMDAFAVSISAGISASHVRFSSALRLALVFWFFQALMPLIGWIGGKAIAGWIEPIDHWVVLIVLVGIGISMIRGALSDDDEAPRDLLSWKSLIALGIATSIDALAVGVSFAFLAINIWEAILIIGLTTFVICLCGVYIGRRFGHLFEKKAEILGGIILIFIGIKIFFSHMFP